ncbi:hypothetical protein ABMX65_13450 [Vibrio vulnificus]|uniref:hypothetical protein n=1 Tax=Vibrio vulnificus TaxID=672 RepID=UPI004059DD61
MNSNTLHMLVSLGLFLVISLAYRFLLPFGDEPDFTVRTVEIQMIDSIWSPYYWISGLTQEINIISECQVNATPLSLSAQIDHATCSEPIWQVLSRWLITLFIALPFIVCLFFKLDKSVNDSHRKVALSLSLLFPGFIYYLGLFSHEQLTLILSVLIFLFFKNIVIVGLLLLLTLSVDVGNGVVVLFFIASLLLYRKVFSVYHWKGVIVTSFFQVLIVLTLGYTVLMYTSSFDLIAGKSQAMYELLDQSDLVDKYPVLLRPVITFMTFLIFTPFFVKVPLVYVIVGLVSIVAIIKLIRYCSENYSIEQQASLLEMYVALLVIVSFVFMFPNYNNAKYYIFLLPFIIMPFVEVLGKFKILLFFVSLNALIILHLIYFRL